MIRKGVALSNPATQQPSTLSVQSACHILSSKRSSVHSSSHCSFSLYTKHQTQLDVVVRDDVLPPSSQKLRSQHVWVVQSSHGVNGSC